jgi:aspartyl-tRNA(Asn)/glutamyl-tRNA(Gln) amidotransferase subunit A
MSVAQLTLVELAEAIRDGAVTAEAATQSCLDGLDGLGRTLHATVALYRERAMAQARAADKRRAAGAALPPLHGVPLAHKDLFYRAGDVSACGSKIRANFVADTTATVLERLDAAGALDIGRLAMAEFALSPTGYNGHHPHPGNPWAPTHVPGGSSSGSGIAVAARLVPAALGSDTGGSIRQPAAMCGVFGLKPTWSLVPTQGVMPLSQSLDCVGPLTRRARDAARLLDVIAPRAGATFESETCTAARGLAIAVPGGVYRDMQAPAVATRLAEAVAVFRHIGLQVTETTPPDIEASNAAAQLVLTVEAAAIHRRWLGERPQDYARQVRDRIAPGFFQPAVRYVEALSLRATAARLWLDACIGDADVALLPNVPVPVPSIAASLESEAAEARTMAEVGQANRAINYLGLPAASVPCGFDEAGLPVGFQLVGRPYAEGLLLRVAHAFEAATDWHRRVPPHALS